MDGGTARLTIEDSIISDNHAYIGGGVFSEKGKLSLIDSTVTRNVATTGGGVYSSGSDLTILQSTLTKNMAMAGLSRAVNNEKEDARDSAAQRGGAVYSIAPVIVSGSFFAGNSAGESGGAIAGEGTLTVGNSVFVGNTAAEYGGGIFSSYQELTVRNSTLTANTANTGGGIFSHGVANLANSILHNNVGDNYIAQRLHGLQIENNLLGIDPAFVRNPSPGVDGLWGTVDDDYGDLRLTTRSPAIDSGNANLLPRDTFDLDADGNTVERVPFDVEGNPRILGDAVDIGAYEFQGDPAAGSETPSTVVTTDADIFDLCDGQISLREAVYYSNTEDVGTAITFVPALDGARLVLDGAPICATGSVTIDASAFDSLTIDGDGRSGVLLILGDNEPEVFLRGLTITGGASGGGIRQDSGKLTIIDCDIVANSGAFVGGVSADCESTTIVACQIMGNTTTYGIGGIYSDGKTNLVESVVCGNCSNHDYGGIESLGDLRIQNSTITANSGRTFNVRATGSKIVVKDSIITGRALSLGTRHDPRHEPHIPRKWAGAGHLRDSRLLQHRRNWFHLPRPRLRSGSLSGRRRPLGNRGRRLRRSSAPNRQFGTRRGLFSSEGHVRSGSGRERLGISSH